MIRVKNLTKDYGGRKGIFDLSFEVENGEVFGLLGPEGAGKTTVISQLLGFASASRGRCFINGKSCHTRSAEIMEFTGNVKTLMKDGSEIDFCTQKYGAYINSNTIKQMNEVILKGVQQIIFIENKFLYTVYCDYGFSTFPCSLSRKLEIRKEERGRKEGADRQKVRK